MKTLHISVGAGFENDRRELGLMAAEALACMPEGADRYLIFECLAERTLAKQVMADSVSNQIDLALSHLKPSHKLCKQHGIRVVTNLGGIDPVGVASGVQAALGETCRVIAVTGDRLALDQHDGESALSKNVYAGAEGIVSALQSQADIVITGRVADPALALGPAIHSLNIDWTDWHALANATLAGHLIECGTQVSGGYFSDENATVPDLDKVGPPVATVTTDSITLSKPLGGGILNRATVIEQMLYEIGDPANYITPDVVLDLTSTKADELEQNIVRVHSAKGHPAPSQLKSLLCRHSGWFAEGTIIYVGSTAATRAKAAMKILEKRIAAPDIKLEILNGHVDTVPRSLLRLALRTQEKPLATDAVNELEALYLNGPAAGGGIRSQITPLIDTIDGLVPRDAVSYQCSHVNQ
ncbi:MAG: acyclic terpene utilization AtuA family protein [Pseudomonadota bacterium]